MSKAINKARALDALLECKSFSEAAEKAGIDRRTLYTYLQTDPEFAREYRRRLEVERLERFERLEAEREAAIMAVREIMTDKEQSPAIRLRAAAVMLEACEQAREKAEVVAQQCVNASSPLSFDL